MLLPLGALWLAAHGAYRAWGFRSRLIRAGERNLHLYDRRGAGRAPPVLLVHGMGGNAAGFLPLVRAVARASRRVVVLDLPGHGRSRLCWLFARDLGRHWASPPVQQFVSEMGADIPGIGLDVLGDVQSPVLILWGEGDRILPASSVEYFRTHLRNGTVETIPHCGHLPMVESSRFVAARIARFLAEL